MFVPLQVLIISLSKSNSSLIDLHFMRSKKKTANASPQYPPRTDLITHVSNTHLPHNPPTSYNNSIKPLSSIHTKMSNTSLSLNINILLSTYFIVSTCFLFPHSTSALHGDKKEDGASVPVPMPGTHGTVFVKDKRVSLVSTEFGEISGVKVSDGKDGFYDLQFITMEPNSLFVPAYLHSDMVFYVTSGILKTTS